MAAQADAGNPCDGAGTMLPCEECALRSRFRRERPKTRPWQGEGEELVYDMGIRRPERPLRRKDVQVLCEFHIKDWHGPPRIMGEQR